MAKAKRFFNSHRIFFGLFVFFLAYEVLIGNNLSPWRISDDFYQFYIVDFGMGLCSRFLPGAIYKLLVNKYDPAAVSVYATVLTVLLFAGICIFLEKLLKTARAEDRSVCFAFVLLFLTGPVSFSIFVVGLGLLDLYWMLFTVLFFVFLTKKWLYWLIPFLFVLCVAVHYGSMICYLPMIAILLLYKISITEEKSERITLWIVFGLSLVFAFGCTVYVMMYETRHLVYSLEEFDAILVSRGAKQTYYYNYELYKTLLGEEAASGRDYTYVNEGANVISRMLRHAFAQMTTTFDQNFKTGDRKEILLAIVAVVPVLGVIFSVLWCRLRDENRKGALRKLSLCLMPLLALVILLSLVFFSTDTFRWFSHLFICMMVLFFYVSRYEGDRLWADVRRMLGGIPTGIVVLFLLFYAVLAPTQ